MASDLTALLKPNSVAIVGVSKDESRIGGRLFKYLQKHGYSGRIALVNPKYEAINDVVCYPSLSAIPYPIECALIAVPEKHVLPVLDACVACKVKSAIVFSSGFAEMGNAGIIAQNRIKTLAKEHDLRICGPNCIGIVNFKNHSAFSFSQFLETDRLIPGKIGFISQSGALGGSLLNRAQDQKIGLSCFISSGNEADLEISDYIKHLVLHDEETTVIAAIVEGFKDGGKFLEAAELALEHKKPLIVYKIGVTESGMKAAASHTGSMTGSDAVIDAVFRQKGVVRVQNYDDLLQTAALFATGRVPEGHKVGILTSSGGAGIIMADQYTRRGLEIPEPSEKTLHLAQAETSAFGKISNPFDLTGQIFSDPEMFRRCMKLFIDDENFDIIQVNVSMVAGQSSVHRAAMLLDSVKNSRKPIATWWAAGSLSNPGIEALGMEEVGSFRAPDRCASAVESLVRYHEYRNARAEPGRTSSESDFTESAKKAGEIVKSANGALNENQSKSLLSAYGIPVTREQVATSPQEAVSFAEGIGFPVVMKISSAEILHKSEIDGIRLGISTKEEVRQAYCELIENASSHCPGRQIDGVLIQEMVQGGTEVMVGVTRDPQFGPTVAFGMGGIFVEVLKDISLRLAPLSKTDAEQMISEIKGVKILRGVRGKKSADIQALVDVLMRVSILANDFADDVVELDINPLVVFEDGKGVKALDALVVVKGNCRND